MTIYFKNGMTKEVIQEIGEILLKRITEGSSGKFQAFSYQNGELILILNLDEIVYIE